MIDKVFEKSINKQFEFDEEVALVFDDMLNRSIPFYKQMQELTIGFGLQYLKNNDKVYDLGCSTASTLIELNKLCAYNLNLIGIDNSEAMLDKARQKCKAFGVNITFHNIDLFDMNYVDAKLIMANYTLQFIRPLRREKLIKNIYNSLEDDGVFIFSEKISSSDKKLDKQYIEKYFTFKKTQGYSDFEIAQKREALENVLIPYTNEENIKMINNAGFKHCEILFKWLNFVTYIAIKT